MKAIKNVYMGKNVFEIFESCMFPISLSCLMRNHPPPSKPEISSFGYLTPFKAFLYFNGLQEFAEPSIVLDQIRKPRSQSAGYRKMSVRLTPHVTIKFPLSSKHLKILDFR